MTDRLRDCRRTMACPANHDVRVSLSALLMPAELESALGIDGSPCFTGCERAGRIPLARLVDRCAAVQMAPHVVQVITGYRHMMFIC